MSLSLKVILSVVIVIIIIILLLLAKHREKKTWMKVVIVILLGVFVYIWLILPVSQPPSNEPTETSQTSTDATMPPSDTILPTPESSTDSAKAITPEPNDDWYIELEPDVHPDPLNLRDLQYEATPIFDTQNDLTTFVLYKFLNSQFEFELFLDDKWAIDEGTGYGILNRACETAMSYYLFSAYKAFDMFTEDRGDEGKVYAKIKLIYSEPEYDLEAKTKAIEFIQANPVPREDFQDFESEKEYANMIHDFVANKVTYSPIGYDPESMFGMEKYEAYQEAYNVLGEEENTAVCAGYARAFALIAQYAGINAVWVFGNETDVESHAWNVIYPCDGSEPVLVDVTWDDTMSDDSPTQEYVSDHYFYISLSEEYEHTPSTDFDEFLRYIN